VPEGFFPGRDHYWIFTKYFLGEVKSGEIRFFLLETKKTTFFAENFKIHGGQGPLFRFPCLIVVSKCLKRISQTVTSLPQHILLWSGFSTLLHVKIKNRNRLDLTPKDSITCALSATQPRIDNLVETSHKSKNHTEVYLAICLLLLTLKLNKIRCFIVKHILCLLIFVPKWRLRGDISIVLSWWATTFCWKRQVGHSIKNVGNHWTKQTAIVVTNFQVSNHSCRRSSCK